MGHALRTAASLALLLAASPALPEDGAGCLPPEIPGVEMLAAFGGRCTRAVHMGLDRTAECTGQATSIGYRNGKSAFAFQLGEALTLVMSGRESSESEEVFQLTIDKFNAGAPNGSASGTCALDATDMSAAVITCRILSGGKETAIDFVASGPPKVLERCKSEARSR